MGWLAGTIKDWNIDPTEITAIASAPNHCGKGPAVEIEAWILARARLPTGRIGGFLLGVNALLSNPAVNAATDSAVHSIGLIEIGR
jgi:hypothetical protein